MLLKLVTNGRCQILLILIPNIQLNMLQIRGDVKSTERSRSIRSTVGYYCSYFRKKNLLKHSNSIPLTDGANGFL